MASPTSWRLGRPCKAQRDQTQTGRHITTSADPNPELTLQVLIVLFRPYLLPNKSRPLAPKGASSPRYPCARGHSFSYFGQLPFPSTPPPFLCGLAPCPLLDGHLHGESLNLVAESADLGVEVRRLVRGEGHSDDRARHTAGAADGGLAGEEDVGDVLLLGEEGEMQHDAERLRIGSEDDELAGTTGDAGESMLVVARRWGEMASARTTWWPRWLPS